MPHTIPACPKRVLVIEDNSDLAEALCAILGICGHCVQVAYDGREGIEKARTFAPEAVICDIGMPHVDGFEVARTLRADPRLRGAILIALTARDDEDDARAAGFDHYLVKPADLQRLARLLA